MRGGGGGLRGWLDAVGTHTIYLLYWYESTIYLLCWYKSTNTDAEGAAVGDLLHDGFTLLLLSDVC